MNTFSKRSLAELWIFRILCFIYSLTSYAQSTVTKGVVLDIGTKEPIPFAHIFIDEKTGTITNSQGRFELIIPDTLDNNFFIQVSSIGYKSLVFHVDLRIEQSIIINLYPKIDILNEVIISAEENVDSAILIMEKVIANINKNYSTRKYGIEAFYREANISDTIYSRLIEAQIYIADKGYNSTIESIEMELLQLRKTEDNRNLSWRQSLFDWLYSINGSFKILANDRIRLSNKHYNETDLHENISSWIQYDKSGHQGSIRMISKSFLDGCDWNIVDILDTGKDTTFVLEYLVKRQFAKRQAKGVIYISKSDWAIQEIHSSVVKPDSIKYFQLDYTLKNSRSYYKTFIKYQKHNNKYYLKYIKSNSIGTSSLGFFGGRDHKLFYESKGKMGTIYQENELFITSIVPFRRISKKNRLDKEGDLYNEDFDYDSLFWSNYNYPLLNPLTKKMQSDLKNSNDEIFIK